MSWNRAYERDLLQSSGPALYGGLAAGSALDHS